MPHPSSHTTLVVHLPDQTDGDYGYMHLKEDGTAAFRKTQRHTEFVPTRWFVGEDERLCVTESLELDAHRECGLFRMTGDDLYIHGDNGEVVHMKARLLRGTPPE